MTQIRHIGVKGRVNGADGATIEIDEDRQVAYCRPTRERRTYDLPLQVVAEMIVARVVKNELVRSGR